MRPDTDTNARVLVVDDDPLNASLLARLLTKAGYHQVDTVTESWDAVRRVRSFEPDIVLLDLHMPAPDGFEILRQLSAMTTEAFLPVLVLTGDAAHATREQALSLGASDFLTKPYSMAETLLRVRNLITIRRQNQELHRHTRELEAEMERRSSAEMETELRRRQLATLVQEVESRLTTVYQPIVDLRSGALVGAEALARFDAVPYRPPNEWFAEATQVGLGTRLELAALASALSHADLLPADAFLALNLSPSALRSPALPELLTGSAVASVVIELTAHEPVLDYEPLKAAMSQLRGDGVRFSVDDTGTGFSGLRHILQLEPDLIKLDLPLVHDIDRDPARRSMARALVHFASEIGARLIAMGIETDEELRTVRELGIQLGQGYALGRPQQLPFADASHPIAERSTAAPPSDGTVVDLVPSLAKRVVA